MAKYRITPVPLRYVSEVYYPGVFGNFVDTISKRLDVLRREPSWLNSEKYRFYEYLLSQVDTERYGRIQDEYLRPPMTSGCLKYLDPVSWFEHKFEFAHLLEFHKKPPMKILDFGTGPGHFLVIARFYGHEAIGTELPDHVMKSDVSRFYKALSEIYCTQRIAHRIEPDTDLADLPSGINLVTAFSVAFNLSRRSLWDVARWEFFLRSLKAHVLAEDGALFMTLMNKKLDQAVWEHLKSRSVYFAERTKHILIKDFPVTTTSPRRKPKV